MLDHKNLVAWLPLKDSSAPLKGGFTITDHGAPAYTDMRWGRGRVFDEDNRMRANAHVTPVGPKTIEFTLRTHSAWGASNDYLYGNAFDSADNGVQILLLTSGELLFRHMKGTGGDSNFLTSVFLVLNTTYHVVCAWDGTTGSEAATLWIDGVKVSSATPQTSSDSNGQTLQIGGRKDNVLRAKCDMCELRVLDVVLPVSDVQRVMLNLHPISV